MKKKIALLALILVLGAGAYLLIDAIDVEAATVKPYDGSIYDEIGSSGDNYADYLADHLAEDANSDLTIEAASDYVYSDLAADDLPYTLERETKTGLYVPESGDVSWLVEILETGYYNFKIEYFPIEGRSAEITRGLKIDDEYPFSEAQSFTLPRIWEDEYDVSLTHVSGEHDLKPSQLEKERWNVFPIRDTEGFYRGVPYSFYLEAGTRKITIAGSREPFIIGRIYLYHEAEEADYQAIETLYQANDYPRIGSATISETGFVKVQGESSFEKSTPILAPVANWSSYRVDPYEKFITRYNTIGGTTWRVAGDWVSWQIEVPASGLYQLTFKVLQNYRQGMYSTRILTVNGQVPFSECRNIQFKYDSDWQNVTLGSEDQPYWFYLNEGTNVVSLEATIGVYADIVRRTEQTIATLNTLYRKVVMIAGATPNEYQDYLLEERIDGLYEMIAESITELQFCVDGIIGIAGERSTLVSSFERTLYQLKKFQKSEQNIQTGLTELDDNIAALGTWVMTISEQSLAVDCLYAHGEDCGLPKAGTNFFQKFWHELVMLFGSYGANTSLESSLTVDGPTITVWISSGRDQSQLLRQLIDDSFTSQHNINVKLKLVSPTALLPATLSGNGPDVAIGVAQNIPVNWGIRNALLDLAKFPDYEEVSGWFHESAVTPFAFGDSVYGLPDTQDFLVSFVRTDIVNELGLNVPKTWDEVIDTLPNLQRQYLDYYLPNTKGALTTLLYSMVVQKGGSLYNEIGSETALTEPNATDAFIDFTTFFSDYGFAISANFPNRFRSGEMPMGVYGFSLYNTLAVFAPEIRGQWEFAELPGYVIDGIINNATASTVSGSVILADTQEPEASWEFLKWWLGEEAQTGYARGMEAILGAAARYLTANLEAFEKLPWSVKDYELLNAQRNKAVGVPTYPGDYIVGRYIDNAFRSSINSQVNPRDSLYEYCEKINIELARKREEFGLDEE